MWPGESITMGVSCKTTRELRDAATLVPPGYKMAIVHGIGILIPEPFPRQKVFYSPMPIIPFIIVESESIKCSGVEGDIVEMIVVGVRGQLGEFSWGAVRMLQFRPCPSDEMESRKTRGTWNLKLHKNVRARYLGSRLWGLESNEWIQPRDGLGIVQFDTHHPVVSALEDLGFLM